MVKRILIWLLVLVVILIGGWFGWNKLYPIENPQGRQNFVARQEIDYSIYDFDSLRDRWQGGEFVGRKLEIKERIGAVELRRANLGYTTDFETRMFIFKSGDKQISGMINLPAGRQVISLNESNKSPVVIMVRGYADKNGYYPGFGSWRVADELAKAGFVTISLDFLGYGESDMESLDMLEARFEKVENLLDLLASVKKLGFVDSDKISFWAHSNGGQIVLSVLEVTGEDLPTVLWAPMTNPFPQSILDTADGLDDGGEMIRKAVFDFEDKYDSRRYAFENYYDWIRSPVLIIQGDNDVWCQVDWQRQVVASLNKITGEAELVVMPGADHNMGGSWQEAVDKTKTFFSGYN